MVISVVLQVKKMLTCTAAVAVIFMHTVMAELLGNGENVNGQDEYGYTPM